MPERRLRRVLALPDAQAITRSMSARSTHDLPTGAIAVVLGTRPEIIKLGNIIRLLGPAVSVIHTGQHYDAALSESFLRSFGVAEPSTHLGVGGKSRGAQIGEAVAALDSHLDLNRPLALMVQGDTNAALAGGLAANAREIPLVHVEAGLRSHDRRMPEEHNRVLVDHLGDLLCAPTETSRQNLIDEGILQSRIRVTGNTVVEALEGALPGHEERSRLLAAHGFEPKQFILATFHRPENVDDPQRFEALLEDLGSLPLPVLLPLHPRSVSRVEEYGFDALLENLKVISPIGYRDFIGLAAESAYLVSDSGGVQEEVSVLKRPVIVVRRSTERPEVIGTFARLCEPGQIGEVASQWLLDVEDIHRALEETPSPYGDGSASQTIVDETLELVSDG